MGNMLSWRWRMHSIIRYEVKGTRRIIFPPEWCTNVKTWKMQCHLLKAYYGKKFQLYFYNTMYYSIQVYISIYKVDSCRVHPLQNKNTKCRNKGSYGFKIQDIVCLISCSFTDDTFRVMIEENVKHNQHDK